MKKYKQKNRKTKKKKLYAILQSFGKGKDVGSSKKKRITENLILEASKRQTA